MYSTFGRTITGLDKKVAPRFAGVPDYLDNLIDGISVGVDDNNDLYIPDITRQNVTLYVRTDGNDANDGLSNTPGGAKLTIFGALDAIPRIVRHNYTIQIADGIYVDDTPTTKSYDRLCVYNSYIRIQGNTGDKTAVEWKTNVNKEYYWGKGLRVFVSYMTITDIEQYFYHGSFFQFNNMVFNWSEPNSIMVYENSYVSLSSDIKIRTTANSHEGCISIHEKGYMNGGNFDALDTIGNVAVLVVVYGGHFDFIGSNSVIDDFLLGFGIGTFGSGTNEVPPSGAFIDNATGSSFVIQNCTTGIKIYNHSHVTYRWAKPTYIGNTFNEDIQAGSTYQQAL